VLAGELAAADGEVGQAFQHDEERLRPYVTGAQKLPRAGRHAGVSLLTWTDGPGVRGQSAPAKVK
jgi:hypothetical protein